MILLSTAGLTSIASPIRFADLPQEGIFVLSAFLVIVITVMVFLIWKSLGTVIEMSAAGLKYDLNSLKPVSAKWQQIEGITISDIKSHFGKNSTIIKLFVRTEEGTAREFTIYLNLLEKGDEALRLLKALIPQKEPNYFTLQKINPVSTNSMKYKNVEVNFDGLKSLDNESGKDVIPWGNISSIKTDGSVIAGYGSIYIEYFKETGKDQLTIKSSLTKQYLEVVNFILSKASTADIDPGIYNIVAYPLNSAKADMKAIGLLCIGFLVTLGSVIILSFYPPTIALTWIYPLLLLPLSFFPLGWTVKLLMDRYRKGNSEPSKKILWALLYNGGTLLSILILFGLSPASYTWMLADLNAIYGNMEKAEAYYEKAAPALSANADFLFSFGQFNYKKNAWNKAAQYYILAYEKDPTNWMAEPLGQIPHALHLAGRNEEALAWCDRIARDYSHRNDVVRQIEAQKRLIPENNIAD